MCGLFLNALKDFSICIYHYLEYASACYIVGLTPNINEVISVGSSQESSLSPEFVVQTGLIGFVLKNQLPLLLINCQ